MKTLCALLGVLMLAGTLQAQSSNELILEGNKHYEAKKYEDAEVAYRKALSRDRESWKALYNLSNSLYRQKRYQEAGVILDSLSAEIKDAEVLSKLYHNLGNAYMEQKDYQKGVEAYKKALKADPKAEDSRYNLSYALKKLQQQQQQQNQQQQKKQQNQDQKQNPQKQPNPPKEQKPKEQKQQMKKEEMEQMLDALNRNEKELRKKNEKRKGEDGVPASGKNW